MMFNRLKKRTVALAGLLGLAANPPVRGASDPGCAEYGAGGRRLDCPDPGLHQGWRSRAGLAIAVLGFLWVAYLAFGEFNQARQGKAEWAAGRRAGHRRRGSADFRELPPDRSRWRLLIRHDRPARHPGRPAQRGARDLQGLLVERTWRHRRRGRTRVVTCQSDPGVGLAGAVTMGFGIAASGSSRPCCSWRVCSSV